MLGYWKTGTAEPIAFCYDDSGARQYRSYLNEKPAEWGTWELKNGTLTVQYDIPGEKPIIINPVTITGNTLTLGGAHVEFKGIYTLVSNCDGKTIDSSTGGLKAYSDNHGFQMNYPTDLNVMVAPTSRIVSCDTSTFPSVCPKGISPGYPDKTENQTINGVNYCYYVGDDCGMGHCTYFYSYLTVNNSVCYVPDLQTGNWVSDCEAYSLPSDVQKCKSTSDHKSNFNKSSDIYD